MLGQFIIPGAPPGLAIKAFLRNEIRRGEAVTPEERQAGLAVDLRVFKAGRLAHHQPDFAKIPLQGLLEISEATCPTISGDQSDTLVIARCSTTGGDGYFAQEHQLIYENTKTRAASSLLYDQSPVLAPGASTSPIVVLAPKIWVGKSMNSYVAFGSSNSGLEAGTQIRPLEVKVLSQDGQVVCSERVSLAENSTYLYDVRKSISATRELSDTPAFYSVVAKGGAALFAIVTFSVNDLTGNFALEHSLPPDYYVSGDRKRVRAEALEFDLNKSAVNKGR